MAAGLTPSRAARADAIAYLIDAYEGVRVRPGKGLPHAQAVADVLRRAGYDEGTQVLALLHDVVEDTPRTVDDVRGAFGDPMAEMVGALTEDPSIRHYAQRKRDLRSRCVGAGSPVVDVAVADKVATLRHALATETRGQRPQAAPLHDHAPARPHRGPGGRPVQAARRADRAGRLAQRLT